MWPGWAAAASRLLGEAHLGGEGREHQPPDGALAEGGASLHPASVELDHPGGDGQTQAHAGARAGAAPVEGVVEAVQVLGGETHPVVGDGEDGPALLAAHLHPDLAVGLAEVERVLDQVLHRLEEPLPVALDEDLRGRGQGHPHPRQLGAGGQRLEHLTDEHLEPEGATGELHLPRLQPGEEQQVVEHPEQPVGVALGDADAVALLLRQGSQPLLPEHAQVGLHRGERGLEVVGDVGEELLAVPLHALQAGQRGLEVLLPPRGVLSQPGVLPGRGDLRGQGLQEGIGAIHLAAHHHQGAEGTVSLPEPAPR